MTRAVSHEPQEGIDRRYRKRTSMYHGREEKPALFFLRAQDKVNGLGAAAQDLIDIR